MHGPETFYDVVRPEPWLEGASRRTVPESLLFPQATCERQKLAISKPTLHARQQPAGFPNFEHWEDPNRIESLEGLVREQDFCKMSLDPPAYILSLQNNIRARPISWEGAVRAKTITEPDLKKIKAIDKVRKEQRKQTIESDVETYTTLLLGDTETKSIFESAAKRTDIIQYMLVLTGDLVDGMMQHTTTMKR